MEGYHSTVLLNEGIDALEIQDAWYLDCTLGDGGHSLEIIKKGGKVIGVDQDPQALERVRKRFEQEGIDKSKFKLILGNFRDLENLIKQRDTDEFKVNGVIFDLGVSSLQLESSERGFSFMKDGPLDMRMDPTLGVRALDLINTGGRKELYELFKNLGEEKYSWTLANSIVSARQVMPITTTRQLVAVIEQSARGRRGEIHPATRVFQALRIAVNDELGAIEEGLDQVVKLVEKNGRIIVISFHSLEDRIVKNKFKSWEKEGLGQILTKKPQMASESELNANPKSRSAKMRIFKKL